MIAYPPERNSHGNHPACAVRLAVAAMEYTANMTPEQKAEHGQKIKAGQMAGKARREALS